MIFPKSPIPLWLHPRKLTRLCNNRFYLVYLQIPPVVQKCLLELLIFQTKIKSKFLNCIWSLCFFGFIQNMTSIFSSWHWLFEEISQLSCRVSFILAMSDFFLMRFFDLSFIPCIFCEPELMSKGSIKFRWNIFGMNITEMLFTSHCITFRSTCQVVILFL